jgi:hypothetical protein
MRQPLKNFVGAGAPKRGLVSCHEVAFCVDGRSWLTNPFSSMRHWSGLEVSWRATATRGTYQCKTENC